MPQEILATANVRCSGKKHRISFAKNGRLIFHDHESGMVSERVVAALGGKSCRCLGVLQLWQRRIKDQSHSTCGLSEKIPKEILRIADMKRGIFWKRCKKRTGRSPRLPLLQHLGRAGRRYTSWLRNAPKSFELAVDASVKKSLDAHTHVRDCSVYITGQEDVDDVLGHGSIHVCISIRVENAKNGKHRACAFRLLPSWYKSVYQRGLAVVDNAFVVKITGETTDGIHVYAICRESKRDDFLIVPHKAYIRLTPDGKPISLRWLE